MRLPTRGKQFRNIALLYGVILFLWIPVEDFQTLPVVIFGTGLAQMLLLNWILGRLGGKTIPLRYLPIAAALVGAVAGLGAVIATVGLMFFKTSLHAHVFPDYLPTQMLAMLERAPLWTLAGVFVGVGVSMLALALRGLQLTPLPNPLPASGEREKDETHIDQ
jgi:hypothetical protein